MARVFIDTNVPFPFSPMDLSLAADYVHDLVWSERLLDEWQRVIVREGHRTPEAAERIAAHIRTGFPDACVPEERYKYLLAEMLRITGLDHVLTITGSVEQALAESVTGP
jgi:hypothetical protein